MSGGKATTVLAHGEASPKQRDQSRLTVSLAAFLAALAGLVLAHPAVAQDKVLTVWDFKSAEPLMRPYFAHVIKEFEARHPGVTVKEIAQPESNYETVLGGESTRAGDPMWRCCMRASRRIASRTDLFP